MSRWISGTVVVVATLGLVCATLSAPKDPTVMLSEVASAVDLVAELEAKVAEIESALVSPESYQAAGNKLRLSAVQLAVLAQGLAEHDEDSKFKKSGPAIRDAAIQIGAGSYDQCRQGLKALHAAMEGKGPLLSTIEYDWSKLGRTRLVMESLRERTDQVRKALRRSKDPAVESRHAATMALLALCVAAHADDVKQESDRPAWRDWSLKCQKEMTLTAVALRQKDATAVLEHFTAAQEACDQCHGKFKK